MVKFSMACRTLRFALPLAAALGLGAGAVAPARAQAVVASVNDDPVTNVDIEQHMRILRVLRKNATKEAALEDVFETRLKLMETAKYKISSGDQDIGWAIGVSARNIKMEPQALLAALHGAGVTEDQWKQRWKAEAGWMQYIRALNRSLEVSENEVRSELTKEGKAKSTEYTIRQVILVAPSSASGETLASRMSDANALRSRFSDCTSGMKVVEAMRDAAIKEPVTRSASALSEPLRKILDQTSVGHLTPPSRGQLGIEMLAVCGKKESQDSSAAESLRSDLLFKKLQGVSDRRYKEIRSKAVIVKR